MTNKLRKEIRYRILGLSNIMIGEEKCLYHDIGSMRIIISGDQDAICLILLDTIEKAVIATEAAKLYSVVEVYRRMYNRASAITNASIV